MKKNKLIFLLIIPFYLMACSTAPVQQENTLESSNGTAFKKKKYTFAKNDDYVILISKKNDTSKSLAKKYLGDENKAWVIEDFNNIEQITARREIVIPLKSQNPSGVFINGFQTIPILCYHRFGNTGHIKLTVAEDKFREQMQFLKDNKYRVISMRDMKKFISGEEKLPKKAVIITIDDGYRSTYEIAYPILKEMGFPATLFLYTDFAGAGDAIKWSHAREMAASGIMDIQPHSKSHPNMSLAKNTESYADYRKRIFKEIDKPGRKIKRLVKLNMHTFAYPYGDTNDMIIKRLKEKKYALGVTVQPGGNPAYAHPYMLHRTMIFGDHSIKEFENSLIVFQERDLK